MANNRIKITLHPVDAESLSIERECAGIGVEQTDSLNIVSSLAEFVGIASSATADMEMYIRAELVEVIQEFFLRLTTSSVVMDIEGTPVSFGVISNLAWEIR